MDQQFTRTFEGLVLKHKNSIGLLLFKMYLDNNLWIFEHYPKTGRDVMR